MDNGVADRPDFKVPNLERGLQVIEFLVDKQRGFTLSDLANALDFPKNSTSRILAALQYYGYVRKEETTREFFLSRKLFSMAYSSTNEKGLMEKSTDLMRELRDATGETVVISIIDHDEGLVLEQIQGTHHFRFVCDPGIRQPLHATASTKVIMAFLPEEEQEALIRKMQFTRFTEFTTMTPQALREDLALIREQGYAVDKAELLEGVHCAAAPIRNEHGHAIAAITVTGPSSRLARADLDALGNTVKEYTLRISQRFGHGL